VSRKTVNRYKREALTRR